MTSREPSGHEPQVDPALLEDRPRDRASPLQICITGIAVVVILGVFFYGISNQRHESGTASGQQMADTPTAQPKSQQQTNQKSGNQNTQPATLGGGGGIQNADRQPPTQSSKTNQPQNGAEKPANQNAAQGPSGSATTGQAPTQDGSEDAAQKSSSPKGQPNARPLQPSGGQ